MLGREIPPSHQRSGQPPAIERLLPPAQHMARRPLPRYVVSLPPKQFRACHWGL